MFSATELSQFTGSYEYHRWSPLFPNMVLSDGAMYIAENGGRSGAYWLMDAIASHQANVRRRDPRMHDFQLWILTVKTDKTALLRGYADSGENPVCTQRIEYTDFEPGEVRLYVCMIDERTRVIMLPTEV